MKSYKIATIQAVRFIVRDHISKPGLVTTGTVMKTAELHTFGISKSSLRNIFSMIMNDMVVAGRATKEHRGAWTIIESHNPIEVPLGSGGVAPKYIVEETKPVVFNPQLTAFLDPPKCTKHVDVYVKIKAMKLKDKTRFSDIAIKLCDEAGIPVTRLINYINEQREQRHSQAAGC